MSGSGKSEQDMYHTFSIKSENQEVFGTFHVAVMQINGKEMYKKRVVQLDLLLFFSQLQGHPTTVFCKISVRRNKFWLKKFR